MNSFSEDKNRLFACIDAGGTTFKCAIISESREVISHQRIPTTDPTDTLAGCISFFTSAVASGMQLESMGIASFGPIDIDPASPHYGTILATPKAHWSNTDIIAPFRQALGLEVRMETDVNAALLAEMSWGAAAGTRSAAYITIGTGIGAGIWGNGALIGAPSHPEYGHIRLRRHPDDVRFPGECPYHSDCLEGLASATALKRRYGEPAEMQEDHEGWDIEAYYLAQACVNLSLTLRLERIVLGGGIMLAPHLLSRIKRQYSDLISGYLGQTQEAIDELLCTPNLGDDAGLYGGAWLAMKAAGLTPG